ncbi:MAG: hypothetical protein E7614_02710 [Ruminococcaceae bacterium]|nr:hypothetical protein [Oscillospiraceae bacterium]
MKGWGEVVNAKKVNFRIEPYFLEASVQIIIDIIIISLTFALFAFIENSLFVSIAIAVGYFTISMFFHYGVIIKAIIDKRKGDCVTEIISIENFDEEYSFLGDRLGHSYVRFFYPEAMGVGKYKIKVINNQNEKKKLRSVMSGRRLKKFHLLKKDKVEHIEVTYLKRSKILLEIDLAMELDKKTRKRDREEVYKSISYINTQL